MDLPSPFFPNAFPPLLFIALSLHYFTFWFDNFNDETKITVQKILHRSPEQLHFKTPIVQSSFVSAISFTAGYYAWRKN